MNYLDTIKENKKYNKQQYIEQVEDDNVILQKYNLQNKNEKQISKYSKTNLIADFNDIDNDYKIKDFTYEQNSSKNYISNENKSSSSKSGESNNSENLEENDKKYFDLERASFEKNRSNESSDNNYDKFKRKEIL